MVNGSNNSLPPPDGAAPQPQPPAALPIPEIEILYRDTHANDGNPVRVLTGLRIGGVAVGGVVGATLEADVASGSPVVFLKLKVTWPTRYVDANEPSVIATTRMPPEPPRGPRRI